MWAAAGLVPLGSASATENPPDALAHAAPASPVFLAGPVAVLAESGIVIGRNTTIAGGATVVRAADAGAHLGSTSAVLAVDRDAHLDGVAGDTVSLGRNTTVGELATNSPAPGGVVSGQTASLAVPLNVPFPSPGPASAGSQNIAVARGTAVDLPPGAYGDLSVARSTTVHLTGGDYVFSSMAIDRDTRVLADEHAQVTVTGTATVGRNTVLGDLDSDTTGLSITVLGADPAPGNPAVSIDRDARVGATLAAPSGTVSIGRSVTLVGSLAAVWVSIDRDVRLSYRAPTAATTPLAAALVEPFDLATVDGKTVLRTEETTGAQIASVDYYVDGAIVGTATDAPYSVVWDATTATTDQVTVTATLTDTTGRTTSAAPITLRIAPADTTDEARMQADFDNGALTPEDFTRYAVYRWLNPDQVPADHQVPAQYQVPADVLADDTSWEVTDQMIWATQVLDTIDPAVRAEVLQRLAPGTDPNETAPEPLTPEALQEIAVPVFAHLAQSTDAITSRPGASANPAGASAAVEPAAVPVSRMLASVTAAAPATPESDWRFGELVCDPDWTSSPLQLNHAWSVEECSYTTQLVTFNFNIHDPDLGVDTIDVEDWYLRTAADAESTGLGGPNGVPDKIDELAIGYWQAARTYAELGFASPGHVTVDLDRGPGSRPYSWPVGHIHLRRDHGVYVMRHEGFHQFEYATAAGLWLSIGAETAASDVMNPTTNDAWWAEASAEWAAHQAAEWAERQSEWYTYETPGRSLAYIDERYLYDQQLWDHLGTPTQALTAISQSAAQPQYGAFLFAEYLDDRYGSDVIAQTWHKITPGVAGFGVVSAIDAIATTLDDDGANLAQVMQGYHAANYSLTNPTDSDLGYHDPDRFHWANRLTSNPDRGLPGRTTIDVSSLAGAVVPRTGRVEIAPGGAAYLELAGSTSGDGQVATVQVMPRYLESGVEYDGRITAQVHHIASYQPLTGYPGTGVADECPGWDWAQPIAPDQDGTFALEVSLFPACPTAVVVVSSADPISWQTTKVDYAITARSSSTGTIEEDLGSYGTQYRVNSGGNLDRPLTAEDGTLHFQIDLSDRTGWWLTGDLCVVSRDTTPRDLDIVRINGVPYETLAWRLDSDDTTGRYRAQDPDFSSWLVNGVTCYDITWYVDLNRVPNPGVMTFEIELQGDVTATAAYFAFPTPSSGGGGGGPILT